MIENTPDPALREIATVFRCHPDMALAIAERIRQKLGQPVSNADIARVMKSIPPTRLSVEAVVAKLGKRPQRKPPVPSTPAAKPTRAKRASGSSLPADSPREKASLQEQLAGLLTTNWARARAEKLTVPNMSAEKFIKAVRTYTGHKDAPLRRILNAALALDRRDILLTPNVVADKVNDMVMNGDEG